jgi:multicomponent Na+:H+ antiporter subunit B
MTARVRARVFLPVAAVLAGLLLWGLAGLPDFGATRGAYARYVALHATTQRHVTNVPSAVVFDYRGVDTLGEELILFTCVIGVALLLRSSRSAEERGGPEDELAGGSQRRLGVLAVPGTLLLGVWLVAYGYLTPGGGFQGGVVCGAAALLVWAVGGYRDHLAVTPTSLVDAAEGLGAAAFVTVGLGALVAGQAYLADFLPLDGMGTLTSGGTIIALNAATGLEVAAATVLVLREFLKEYVQSLPHAEKS